MLLGDKDTFAIECIHEPLPNPTRRVFGRMCIWAAGQQLGSLDVPACMLSVTEGRLQTVLSRLGSLQDASLAALEPSAAFDPLDNALYLNEDRSMAELETDAKRFSKFNFLTNGGESFDQSKSFLLSCGESVRLLFRTHGDAFQTAEVSKAAFTHVVEEFLSWISDEEERAG